MGHVFWLSENSLWRVQIYSQEGDDSLSLFVRFRGITQCLIIGEPAKCSKDLNPHSVVDLFVFTQGVGALLYYYIVIGIETQYGRKKRYKPSTRFFDLILLRADGCQAGGCGIKICIC